MNIKNVAFLKSCRRIADLPRYPYPEAAFIGRSNVGKSSLLNMLMGKKDLVKTGSRPGVTVTLNFFVLNDNISLVDLPGFGYAKLPQELKKTFLPLMREYLTTRPNLKLVFFLMDIRRTPGDDEQSIIELLAGKEIPVAIILTKCDKLSGNQRANRVREISAALGVERDSLFISSASTGEGRKDLLGLLKEYCAG